MTASGFRNQVKNKNFLSPTGFKFVLNRAPKVVFFSNSASIPGLNLGVAIQPGYLKDIPQPGDKLEFGDLTLRFLVDEDLENYLEIQHWLRGLGFPDTLKEIYDWQKSNPNAPSGPLNMTCDGTLNVLSSSNVPNFKVKFLDMFPVSLSELDFDATDSDIDYLTANVTFKYTIYNITDLDDNIL